MLTDEKINKKTRKYYSENFDINNWSEVESALNNLLELDIKNADDLLKFLEKKSELGFIINEQDSWNYINMTCHADDEKYTEIYEQFFSEIVSKAMPFDFKMDQKFYNSPFKKELDPSKYAHLEKIISNSIELFREENIPLFVKENELVNKYGQMFSELTVNYKGEEKTLSQMTVYLKDPDRTVREEAWKLRFERLYREKDKFNELFDQLKDLRIQIAKNAGFDNYRDYMHTEKGRFSYTPEDLMKFHDAVEKEVVPFLKELNEERKNKLNIKDLKPWDLDVEINGKLPKPFDTVEDFVNTAIDILNNVKNDYGIELNKMMNSEFLDLENRKGKAPGGYCSSLPEHGTSFIFMNAVGVLDDVSTLLHESGHSMHSKLSSDITIEEYEDTPSEVAELASMSMEFLTLPYWNKYYKNEEDYKNACIEQIEGAVKFFPWCMIVDAFQHWIYTNPNHTAEEREEYFGSLMERFNTGVDWSSLDDYKKMRWMFQLHIFEIPFYYIEYGMSQIGALAVYRNYKKNPKEAVEKYNNFLKLGYTVPVNEIYETAGIKFDFSAENIKEIVDFVKAELNTLKS